MQTLKFKTNINCGGCIATVTPFLNDKKGIEKWEVDIANPQKLLTVNTEDLSANDIIETLQKAGYKAEQIQ
ncbi:MAG: heavy-metal-associated domain-containing protein [Flavipsychrobacter sp.]